MTKSEMTKIVEGLVEKLATRFGAVVQDKQILVAGKPQKSREAIGGPFNLDACRGLVGAAIARMADTILSSALPNIPALVPISPDGTPMVPAA